MSSRYKIVEPSNNNSQNFLLLTKFQALVQSCINSFKPHSNLLQKSLYLFIYLLKYSRLIMLCQFHLHSKVIQTYIYTYVFRYIYIILDTDVFFFRFFFLIGLPWQLSWLRIHLQCGRPGFDPSVRRRFPGGGFGNPLMYSSLGNPHGGRNLVGYSPKESDITEQLSLSLSPQRLLQDTEYSSLCYTVSPCWFYLFSTCAVLSCFSHV